MVGKKHEQLLDLLPLISYNIKKLLNCQGVSRMKKIRSIQKYVVQFGYEHKNMNNHFSGMKKNVKELSKLLEDMFPKEKKEEGKRK